VKNRWPFLPPRPDTIRHRLIFALDVDSIAEAERLVALLHEEVGVFKVGKQLFLHAGPEVVRMIHRHGAEVFLDLKFHDIPHTVAKAGVEAARLGVRFFDVHASGSFDMMERTQVEVARVCRREGIRRPKILAVTVLTSLGKGDLRRVGVADEVEH
jgi:orotidine-5'-phosphate decarboxylase